MPNPPSPIVGVYAGPVVRAVGGWLASWAAGHAMDAMLAPGPEFNGDIDVPPLSGRTDQEILNNITINVSPNFDLQNKAWVALSELANRPTGAPAIKGWANANPFPFNAAQQQEFANLNGVQLDVLGRNGKPGAIQLDLLDAGARKALKKAFHKDKDRWFVSREFHEYTYCDSHMATMNNRNQFEEVAHHAGIALTHPGTYGTFVDAFLMRKAIAKLRQVKRLAYGRNSKALAASIGVPIHTFFNGLVSVAGVQAVLDAGVNQWNDLAP